MPRALTMTLVVYGIALTLPAEGDAAFKTGTLAGCFLDSLADTRTSYLSQIIGHIYVAEHNKVKYTLCVCCNVTEDDVNATVLAAPSTVFGRRNCSHLAVTDRWTLLEFHGGDNYTTSENCSHGMAGRRNAVVVITCDASATETTLSVAAADNCSLFLEMRSPVACPTVHPPVATAGLSHGSVFCILFVALAGTYLLVGVCYRRLICGAKGIDQLPNKDFWLNLGHLQADGCNLVCRHGERPDSGMMSRSDGWQQIAGGSFTDSDRDDAPLQP